MGLMIGLRKLAVCNLVKSPIQKGTMGELTFTVTEQHVIDFADEIMPAVLSTPWLVWFLEHAARNAVLPFLDASESTVGVNVNVDHVAPTIIGIEVKCEAKVILVDDTEIFFSLRAWDDKELIAKGTHKLRVIEKARLRRRVDKKF